MEAARIEARTLLPGLVRRGGIALGRQAPRLQPDLRVPHRRGRLCRLLAGRHGRSRTRRRRADCPFHDIGTFNWIAGYRDPARTYFADRPQRESTLELGSDAAITARHLIDCIDKISIGSFTTVAGHRSQLLTHAIDFRAGRQDCSPIVIGARCFIGTGCIILKGAEIADKVIVAAGSVVTGNLKEECSIYGGNPAAKFRSLDADAKYFTRSVGMV